MLLTWMNRAVYSHHRFYRADAQSLPWAPLASQEAVRIVGFRVMVDKSGTLEKAHRGETLP